MTNLSYEAPSRHEIQALMNEANQMRAEALRRMFVGLGRAIAAGVGGLVEAFAQARRAQRMYGQLSAMSARELADIGITRGDIPAVVAGVFRREVDDQPAAVEATAPAAEVTELKSARPAVPASEIRKAA